MRKRGEVQRCGRFGSAPQKFLDSSNFPDNDGTKGRLGCVMRRRAFNQAGSILRGFAPKRSYTQVPLSLQDVCPESEAGLENSQQSAQDGTVDNASDEQKTSLEHENGDNGVRKSSVYRPLPLSPLMDPSYLAAKQKYKVQKAEPSKEPTPFQQQLARNPYAQALATPVRQCALTRTQLPSFFLQDFELIAHPTTNEPWYMPRSLTSAKPSPLVTNEEPSPDSSKPMGIRRGQRSYVLSRRSLLRAIREPTSGFFNGEERFISSKNRRFKSVREVKTRWRTDMDTFVLNLMRRRIVEELKYLYGRKAGYLNGYSDWDGAKRRRQVGALLWLGPANGKRDVAFDDGTGAADDQGGEKGIVKDGETSDNQGEENAIFQDSEIASVEAEVAAAAADEGTTLGEGDEAPVIQKDGTVRDSSSNGAPGEFATIDKDKEMRSKLPVHNLQLLLGDELIGDLRLHAKRVFKHEFVGIINKKTTIDIQLRLWKLQGYLAEHKKDDDE